MAAANSIADTLKLQYEMAGKTVVVTGAGRGIGRGVAQVFASIGATSIVLDKDEAGARETVQLCLDAGVQDDYRQARID